MWHCTQSEFVFNYLVLNVIHFQDEDECKIKIIR